MWNDPSKRPLIVFGAILLLAIGGGGLWWWNDKAPERHLKDIIEQAYDHAGIDGPDAFSKYNRRTDDCGRTGTQSNAETWRASKGGLSRLESIDEAAITAVRLADGLQRDGWEVRRYVIPSSDSNSDVSERRRVHAERGSDTFKFVLQGVTISISGSTGPCNNANATDLDDPPLRYEPVDSFPD